MNTTFSSINSRISLLVGLAGIWSISAFAQFGPIPVADDLQRDAQSAQKTQKPIVLFTTASDCPFCEVLREEVFQFLPNDERFILREVIIDNANKPVTNFDGSSTSLPEVADQYGVNLTPTVLFVGTNGEQLIEPMVGVITLDFYNYYFDEAIKQSTQAIKSNRLAQEQGVRPVVN